MNSAKTRILITGAKGMLGYALVEVLKSDFDLISFSHQECDITDSSQVLKILEKEKPALLINAAAYTKVDDCEANVETAYRINGEAVGEMARLCKEREIFLIHFSTDYVFDGRKETPYLEEDETNPLNAYGVSKLESEKAIVKYSDRFLIIRTSWLYGLHGPNFVDKILELVHEVRLGLRDGLKVVDDQVGSPTYTVDLAQAVKFLLRRKFQGLLHVTNSGACSWYEFASQIVQKVGSNVPIRRIKSSEIRRPAKRPDYSVLSNNRLQGLGYRMRPWQEALEDYLNLRLQAVEGSGK